MESVNLRAVPQWSMPNNIPCQLPFVNEPSRNSSLFHPVSVIHTTASVNHQRQPAFAAVSIDMETDISKQQVKATALAKSA